MSGSLDAIPTHRPLADVVFEKLREAIIDGTLEAGQWLRQEALAQELGVSQMPVREALKRLVAEGLAERIPYRGVKVVDFSPQDIMDMFVVRTTLETLVTRFAATRITEETLQALRDNVRQAAQLTRPDQMSKRQRLNTEFHLLICQASGRRFLIQQVEALWGWFPSTMLYEGMRRQEALSQMWLERESREHQAILAALEKRDVQQVEAEIRQHIRHLSEELAEVLDISEETVQLLQPSFKN
jgi:DNA-binding GntR family transcriptional regulator